MVIVGWYEECVRSEVNTYCDGYYVDSAEFWMQVPISSPPLGRGEFLEMDDVAIRFFIYWRYFSNRELEVSSVSW